MQPLNNAGGAQELMYDPYGVWLGIYGVLDLLPWGGGYFAWYDGTDTYFNHVNNIASTSVVTNHAGTAVEDVLFYPWGQNTWKFWGSGGYQFAGMPYYDTTTDTNLTPFRLYSTGLGRWMSPDPLGGDTTNPQSLNRYAYVLNSPTSLIDPLGLQSNGNGPCYEYYCPPSYGGPPPGTGPPPCWTSWCESPSGGWEWNEPNPLGSETAAQEAAWANHMKALFDMAYIQAELNGGITSDQLQAFISMHPEIIRVWGLLASESTMSEASPGFFTLTEVDIYGWSIVENPLAQGGMMASPVASPWAPVAWYGTSATVALSTGVPAGVGALYGWAAVNPIAWRCAASFAFNLLSPPSTFGVDTDEYPCGRAGQMASAGIWSIFHPNGQ